MTPAPALAQAATGNLTMPLSGANDWSCKPSAVHPLPVVLVHGTFANSFLDWGGLAPELKRQGYCVFALDYGNFATDPIPISAGQLGTFVDRVLAATGAPKVSIVGHSQGGMMPRHYLRYLGGAAKVAELIGIAPSNHGTQHPLQPLVALLCGACRDQGAASAFMTNLNRDGDTVPGVDYTVIATRYDEAVIPYQSQFLTGPPERVTNVTVQDKCPGEPTQHLFLSYSSVTTQWVLNALARPGPADPGFRPTC